MSQEEADFIYFRDVQLKHVDFSIGRLDVFRATKTGERSIPVYDVGSENHDGYVRVWCNRKLRMKHRLLFWLYHGYLPKEVDHDNSVRNDNSIRNLIPSNRTHNNKGKVCRSFKQLVEDDIREMATIIAWGDYTITALAEQFGRSRVHIKGILTKKHWSEITDEYF